MNENKEVFYPNWIERCIFYISVIFILLIIIACWFGMFPNPWSLVLFLIIPLLFCVAGWEEGTAKVIITKDGIVYSDIFKKKLFTWENIRQIEIVFQEELSEKGEVISQWTDYNIYARGQMFSLKGNIWDAVTLISICEKITSRIPKIHLLRRNGIGIIRHDLYYPDEGVVH